jgi:probable phosphoglycerate mutase
VGIPLSADGVLQARRAAAVLKALRVKSIVCSPLLRAIDTATFIAAPHGLTPKPLQALRELGLGEWEGLTRHQAASRDRELHLRWTTDPASVSPPSGEALRDASARAIPAVLALAAAHVGKKVVVVTHNLIVRVLACHALGADLSAVGRMRCHPGSMTVVDVQDGRFELRVLNETSHLRAGDQPGPASVDG